MSLPTWFIPLFIGVSLLALVAIPMLLGQRSMHAEGPRLLNEGQLGEAEILGYERDEFHLVRYRFTPADRLEPVQCKKIIGQNEEQFPIGTKVPVRYKPRYPKISVLVPYAHTQLPTS